MRTCLVTGGAGFIGTNLVRALLAQGVAVRVLDNWATGRRANLADIRGEIELIEGDVRDSECVRRAVAGVDAIFHQAALPSVPRSIVDPIATNEVNVAGTLNVLVAARHAGVDRVVFASSSSVYGNSAVLPKAEHMPAAPLSPYAVSKLAAERYCIAWTEVYRLPVIALRYFNVFGPYQDPDSQYAAVIPRFIARMRRGERPRIYGDGLQTRDFTYVENVVRANLLAARAPSNVSGVFNVACGDRIALRSLVERLNEILGTEITAEHESPRPGEVRDSQADLTQIRETLGYAPAVSFDEGLRRTVEFFSHQGANIPSRGL
jgi:UDP-glucose 4-epimerase